MGSSHFDFDSFGPYVEGARPKLDISHWQWGRDSAGNIAYAPNYIELREGSGADAISIRAGSSNSISGLPYADYTFENNYQGSRAAGFSRVSIYWFWRPLNPFGCAQFLAGLLQGKSVDAIIVDVEVPGNAVNLWIFIDELVRLIPHPHPPIWIYTSVSKWAQITGDKSRAVEFGLAVAHYEVDTPLLPDPWKSAGIVPLWHQFTDKGPGAGHDWGIHKTAAQGLDLGWAHPAYFVDPTPPPEPPPNPVFVVVKPGTYLNIRTEPNTNPGTKIGTVGPGTTFEVVREVAGGPWLAVVSYLHSGFVSEV